MAFSLYDVAPRLARARDQWLVIEAARVEAEDRVQASLATERLRAERLVAHRELQALRAAATHGGTGLRYDPKYVRYRQRKLDKARADREKLG